jgi:hypothetical protein
MDHACLLVRLRPIVAFQDGLALVRERSSVQHPLMTDRKPFHALMTEVCVERGWCGSVVDDRSMHVTDFLPDRGMVTVDQFVGWMFEADGVDPSEDLPKWQKHIDGLRDAFIRHVGSSSVDVERLAWFDS